MELGKLKKLREIQKKYTEKLIFKITKECETFNGSIEHRESLVGLKSSLLEKASTIKNLDESIIELVKEKEFEREINESGEFSEVVFKCVARIETCLADKVAASLYNQNETQNSTRKSMPKLPKLALKTFSGDPTEWQSFWDCFKTSVYDTSLSDIDKFNYLRGCLSGQAAKSIEGIPLTSENLRGSLCKSGPLLFASENSFPSNFHHKKVFTSK